ncbi:hypothetical protein D3C84_848760 [compost metagenome]
MDKVGEFQRITNEEHRGVVADDVPVAFLGIELQGETPRITLGIGRTTLATHSREAQEGFGLLADSAEQLGVTVLGDIPGYREGAIGSRALGVYTTLRDVFTVEVGEFFKQVEVIQQ